MQPTLTLSGISALQNTSEQISFRLVGWNVNGSNSAINIGRMAGNDLVINGVVAVPEPSVVALAGVGLAFAAFSMWRKRVSLA